MVSLDPFTLGEESRPVLLLGGDMGVETRVLCVALAILELIL